MFARVVGGGFQAIPGMELTDIGLEIEQCINYINLNYDNILIDKYIIMPNHIHFIVIIESDSPPGRPGNLPLPNVVGQLKSYTTKRFNKLSNTKYQKLWQRNYHDHIIRNQQDYQKIWHYIDTNPQKWELDKYYQNDT